MSPVDGEPIAKPALGLVFVFSGYSRIDGELGNPTSWKAMVHEAD
jgi:hypothetical protein